LAAAAVQAFVCRSLRITQRGRRVARVDKRKEVVATGYDAMGGEYLGWSARSSDPGRDRLLPELIARLPDGADVLDLGCGAGIPSTQLLVERFRVTGVDISAAQLAAARRNVPDATFLQADLASVDFPAASFDGVVALYSISHVPREDHAALFGRLAGWLRSGGLFLASLGARDSPDWQGEWIGGRQMFFSSFDDAANRQLVRSAGFELLIDEVIEISEPEGPVPFLWLLARRQ
jgi:SAM-dependent methyltransferase